MGPAAKPKVRQADGALAALRKVAHGWANRMQGRRRYKLIMKGSKWRWTSWDRLHLMLVGSYFCDMAASVGF